MKLAVIRIRGMIGPRREVKDTMDMLGLHKKHTCVVLPKNDVYLGMIKKAEDFVAWGEIPDETVALLEEKRGAKAVKTEKRSVYFLAPPRKGFKSIKLAVTNGGSLGRHENISELITRMV